MQYSSWQKELQQADRDPRALLGKLRLQQQGADLAESSQQTFPLRVPRSFTARIRPGDSNDPLLRQILPVSEEDASHTRFVPDPLQESDCQPVPGVLHKYHGRVLLVVTGACAIHCRYCFRRHFRYSDANPSHNHWNEALNYINNRPELEEIILSGGDPLTLSNSRLADLFQRLEAIPHLRRLRIHTRIPVVMPKRIDSGFIHALQQTRLKSVMVVHVNHAQEIDDEVTDAIERLGDVQIPVLNQAVLLRNINDSVDALAELSNRLFETGIIPYYLHMLDPVAGAAHFEVSTEKAQKLMWELRQRLPGYLVPKLVREEAGQTSKTPV